MKIKVYDIETLKGMFLYIDYDPDGNIHRVFRIDRYQNDLDALVKYLKEDDSWMVSFNGVNFDWQVLQYIVNNHKKWYDKTADELLYLIYKWSQRIIHDVNYGVFPPFRDETFTRKQIDLFRILHFDNEAKRTSLKWTEFMMDMPNIEEMPYSHEQEYFTPEQCQEIIDYCYNDVDATFRLYKYVRGMVEHPEYKGKDKVQDRLDLIEELGFIERAINYSDVKIGDEINRKGYLELTKIDEKNLYDLKRNRVRTKGFTFGQCIPDYVKFNTPELKNFYERISKVRVSLVDGDKQEFTLHFMGTEYTIAKGGIHSNEKSRIVIPKDHELLIDADVGSQYPNAIVKRNLFPVHLGPKWLVNYKATIDKRMDYKEKGKQDKKYKGLSDMLKLALNGGGFGKTNDRTNWQYGPEVTFYCTIGNQFEMLMLIEMLEITGIHCISANTDGIVCLFDKKLEKEYYEICHQWEAIVGNTVMGILEYTEFSKLIQESINHYWAVKKDGSVKIKGRFCVDVELNKNNTDKISRIERKALTNYFVHGIPIEDTINKEDNMFMFCIGKKASKEYHYESIDTDVQEVHKKLIRYYIAKDGYKLIKRKNEGSEAPGAEITKVTDDGEKAIILNRMKDVAFHLQNVDRQYYIDNAFNTARTIEGRRKGVIEDKNQLKMF